MPCTQPDWLMLVETGFAAGAPALLNLFVPGCTDIVKLKIGVSPWHAKGVRSVIKAIAPPNAIEARKFLFKIGYFTAERGLYYLMLADVTTDFVATWESLIFVAQQCPLPSAGTAFGDFGGFIYIPGYNDIMPLAPHHSVPGMHVGLGTISVFPGFQGTLAYTCEFDSWPERGQGVNVTTFMTVDESIVPISLVQTGVPPTNQPGWTGGHTFFDTTRKFTLTTYHFWLTNTGGTNAQVVGGQYTLTLTGHNQGVVPWGCHPKKAEFPFWQ